MGCAAVEISRPLCLWPRLRRSALRKGFALPARLACFLLLVPAPEAEPPARGRGGWVLASRVGKAEPSRIARGGAPDRRSMCIVYLGHE
jgi:hypothetical protein